MSQSQKVKQRIYENLEEWEKSFLLKEENKVFLVCRKGAFEESGAKKRLKHLFKKKDVTVFSSFTPNPKINESMKGIKLFKKINPDYIIAIGGGSSIDMAKSIKALSSDKENWPDLGISEIPLIAIPTTAGSGSEATPYSTIYIEGKKHSLVHDTLVPDEVVLDPTLTQLLPRKLTAATGLDAFSQAIEAYWSIGATDESKRYSKKAILLVLDHLERAVNNPSLENRRNMLQAAYLAGKAIAITRTTAPHAISYSMTSRFGVLHGHAVALTLGEILEYNANVDEKTCDDPRGPEYVKETMNELLNVLGVDSPQTAKTKIKNLMREIGLATTLSEAGVTQPDTIVKEVNAQRLKNNPRALDTESLRNILKKIS